MTAQWTALVALLVVTTVLGLAWRSAQGRVRATAPSGDDDADARWTDELAAQGVAPGERVTFLQLSAEVCSACRSTARTLGSLAAEEPGVVHLEIDVDDRPDLVRRAQVHRTPTVLVLDGTGAEVARASGGMTPARAREALGSVDAAPVPGRTA
ncbi:thioredoxin family protein [Isoptericola haloaureus]|uniref:Thioredoxin family protein n=1 Tax=Isoptericola haloaureus TaxID=1542902 RepID=A0ABU7Z571_9MICO